MAVEFDVSQAENGGYQISGVDPWSKDVKRNIWILIFKTCSVEFVRVDPPIRSYNNPVPKWSARKSLKLAVAGSHGDEHPHSYRNFPASSVATCYNDCDQKFWPNCTRCFQFQTFVHFHVCDYVGTGEAASSALSLENTMQWQATPSVSPVCQTSLQLPPSLQRDEIRLIIGDYLISPYISIANCDYPCPTGGVGTGTPCADGAQVVLSVALLFAGPLSDRLGRRPLVLPCHSANLVHILH